MMPTWYRAGTVSVSNGSTAVIGAGGTAWVANANPGDAIHLPDGRAYEIAAITGNAALTLATGYLGPTSAGGDYSIQPTRGQTIEFTTAATALLAAVQGYIDGPLSGKFAGGSAGAPALAKADDTDTGLFWAAANVLGLAAGGSARALLSASEFQVDVPISGAAVQSSRTDETAGRLMKVGAFGLGAGIRLDGVDCRTVLTPGLYYVNDPSINKPTAQGGTLLVLADAGSTLTQVFTERNSGTTYVCIRNANGEWQPWRRNFDSRNLLGAVSQSSGVPTGAVIERGSNANGEYVRFADGTQICACSAPGGSASTTNSSNGLFRTDVIPKTFPAAFVAEPVPAGSIGAGGGWWISTSASSTVWNLRLLNQASVTGAAHEPYSLIAFGRWF